MRIELELHPVGQRRPGALLPEQQDAIEAGIERGDQALRRQLDGEQRLKTARLGLSKRVGPTLGIGLQARLEHEQPITADQTGQQQPQQAKDRR